ncbi:MAG: 7TM-DISM domain-containing protein, partial [Gammaproteobacteria bacterium]
MMINNKMKVGLTVRIFTVILVWVVLLAWPDSGRTAENAVIPLSVDTAAVNPSPHITYLLDAAGNLTITDVLSMGFSPLPSGVANFGFTTDKIWLKFTVQNE